MKVQNLFGMNADLFLKKFRLKNVLCVVYLIVTIILNIVLTLCRNESNHEVLLFLNIALDILCFFLLLTYVGYCFLPDKHMLRLYEENKLVVEGEVKEISSSTYRYMKLDCFVILIDEHKYYLPENKIIKFNVGETVKISTAYEVILEVYSDEK